ncbi:hypothetical protein CQS02_20065 [Elizabethkingia miricola]|nr:hypothetical protein CQS02_20065 [Elizabethkingia miricola]
MEGKANEMFLDWITSKYFFKDKKYSDLNIYQKGDIGEFLRFPITKHAYILEWLDSVNLFIEVYTTWESYNKVKQFSFKIVDENDKVFCDKWLSPYFNSRQEATEAAIKKAVEIYNTRNVDTSK